MATTDGTMRASGLPINLGGAIGLTFGNSPLGVPPLLIIAAVAIAVALILKKR